MLNFIRIQIGAKIHLNFNNSSIFLKVLGF
jgi:hypothetical protein